MIGNLPRVQPVKKEQAPPEVRSLLENLQDTMGVPWPPANWRSYAVYPGVMRLFWERLKPMVATEPFLVEALAITELAFRDASRWYLPSHHIDLSDQDRPRIQWELDALEYGNPQLLIQQAALSRVVRGLAAGRDCSAEPRSRPSAYRRPEIQRIDEQEASEEVKEIYQDIKQTLGLPLVNSDYQALAKWPAFLRVAWEDAKEWRERRRPDEYHRLEYQLAERAEMAAVKLCPDVVIDPRELGEALGNPEELENLQRMVQLFTQLLPGLIVNDALFRLAAAGGQAVAPPPPEGVAAPVG